LAVAALDEFAQVITVLSELTPEADIGGVELKQRDGGRHIVIVQTQTPGRVIGRHGTIAEAVRAALAERLGDAGLQLNIVEARDDPDPDRPPPAGPGRMYPPEA
jgi:ribosomal protein S3